MEIDLSAGLMKAKPAKTALPGGDVPVNDSTKSPLPGALDFSTLLPLTTDTPGTEPSADAALVLAPLPLTIPTDPQATPDQPVEVTPETPALPTAEAPQMPATTLVAVTSDPAIAATAIAVAATPVQVALPLATTKNAAQAGTGAVQAAIASTTPNTGPNTGPPESAITTTISPPEPGKKAAKSARFDQATVALSPDTPQKPADTVKDTTAAKPLDLAAKPAAAEQPAPQTPPARTAEPVAAITAPSPNITATAISAPPQPAQKVAELALTADNAESDLAVAIKIDRQVADIQQIAQQPQRAAPAVAAQITSQIQAQISQSAKQVIELRLDPAELGRITIQLSPQDQSITAQITAERPETLDLMRRHSEVLLATLEKAGFSQANLSFQQGSPQQGGREAPRFQSLGFVAEPTAPTLLAPLLPAADGRLDIRL